MLMQNRFISIIAILGTALAIMMILVIVMADTCLLYTSYPNAAIAARRNTLRINLP